MKEIKLADFAARSGVRFYPLDWSPVCTNEHACFVNDMKRFEQLDAQVLGLASIARGRTKHSPKKWAFIIRCSPISPRGAVGDKFGVYLADKGITGRAIAIVDRNGKLAWFKNYEIPTVPDLKEVSDALAKLN